MDNKPYFSMALTYQTFLTLSATIQYYWSEEVQPRQGFMFDNVGCTVG